ncbi:MAG: hypothetical protein J1E37_04670 [Prevotella sp.]|nr:hypothetical protein [Prevotella sp.]
MEKKPIIILCVVMLVTFFMLTMETGLKFLLLLAPFYLLLNMTKDRFNIPATAFPIPTFLIAMLPLVVFVLLQHEEPVIGASSMEGSGNFINIASFKYGSDVNVFAIGDNTAWADYVYMIAAMLAMLRVIPEDNNRLTPVDQKATAIAVGAILMCKVVMCQTAVQNLDTHREYNVVLRLYEMGDLTIYNLLCGYGWILVLVLLYLAVAAFRHKTILASVRPFLLSPKAISIVIAIVAVLFFIASFIFPYMSNHNDVYRGPGTTFFVILAIGVVVIASKKVMEINTNSYQSN